MYKEHMAQRKIKKVFIKNFRSIGSEGLNIDFEQGITALVGKNNSGKSNLIKAIDIVLGKDVWWSDSTFSLEDFYEKNPSNDILIQVFFTEAIEHTLQVGWFPHKVRIYGFQLEYKQYKINTGDHKKGELHLDHRCINSDGNIIMVPSEPPQKGKQPVFNRPLFIPTDVRKQANAVYIPVNRDILTQSPSSQKTLLGALVKTAREDFLLGEEQVILKEEEKNVLGCDELTISRKDLFEKYIEKANQTLKSGELETITNKIHEVLLEHLGDNDAEGVKLDFGVQQISDQYKYLKLSLTQNNLCLPASHTGDGFQSLIVISIFRAFSELKEKNAIFLIEEPEIFLHPHAQKQFYEVLKSISENENQIIYTTHSPEFIRIEDFENVRRLIHDGAKTVVFPIGGSPQLDFTPNVMKKMELAVNNDRCELFFANKVLLVEGQTEKLLFHYILEEIYKFEINKQSISIIDVGGKGELAKYAKLLDSLNIEYYCIYDSDILTDEPEDPDEKRKFNEWNKDAEEKNKILEQAILSDSRFVFDPYLEKVLGIQERLDKKPSSKPLKALNFLENFDSKEDIEKQLPSIKTIIEGLGIEGSLGTSSPTKPEEPPIPKQNEGEGTEQSSMGF